jgi:lipopolysaccharide/colanic/teichoic acid biosynthesis glycosyltransferase
MKGVKYSFPVWKRMMDILLSCAGLILLSPVFLVLAAIIKVTSPGPAFLKQERIGRHGKPFGFWKFRTMRVNADPGPHQNHLNELIAADTPMVKLDMANDPRVFPFGRILRNTCVDELPQLINVLRGEMSLVGPRPCLVYEANQYQDWHKRRFEAVPGMTGLWQVSGKNKTTFTEMIRLDIAYARNVSLMLDLKILLMTIPVILSDLFERRAVDRRNITQVKRAA